MGQRVATDGGASNSGEVAKDPNATSVDRKAWRLVTIRAEQTWADGTSDTWEVQTLQPAKWLRRNDVDAGEVIALDAVLDLKEMGAPEGLVGEVVSVSAASEIEGGAGRVVLTTVNHLSNFVYDLTLRGSDGELDTLGVTGWHKFYDEAEGWQSVSELSLGDSLRGRDGERVTVVAVERDAGVQRVYNMTVEADHVYYVGDLTTLTHNTCPPDSRQAIQEAYEAGIINEMIIHRPPRHHIFPQQYSNWFNDHGISIDDFTVEMDQGTHSALHFGGGPGQGGRWWNETIMSELQKVEDALGRQMTVEEILKVGQDMMRRANISDLPIMPY